jgi:hypothetical protein
MKKLPKGLLNFAGAAALTLGGLGILLYQDCSRAPQEYYRHCKLESEINVLECKRNKIEDYFKGNSLDTISNEFSSVIETRRQELERVNTVTQQYKKTQGRLFLIGSISTLIGLYGFGRLIIKK